MMSSYKSRRMSRAKAASIHVAISACVAIIVAALLYFVWFPQPWFIAAGASMLMLLLIGVDVCIGPLLTAIVFGPEKSRLALRVDLVAIAAFQIIALVYGLHVIVQARPVFIVAAVDRYVLVAADQVTDEDLAKGSQPAFRQRSWTGPRLVGATPPTGSSVPQHVTQVLAGGKDIAMLPEFYVPYPQVADDLMERANPLSRLALPPDAKAEVAALQADAEARADSLRYLPVQRQEHSYTAIVSMDTQRPIAVLDVDAWAATRPADG